MPERLVFPGKQRVELEAFDPPAPDNGQVKVKTLCSLISTGTENIVFNRLFDTGTHWDNWVKYPFYPGYAVVGEVIEKGSEVEGLKPGDRVVLRAGHASHHVVPADRVFAVPEGIKAESAPWFALAKITFMGARAARHALGDDVLIIGAGPIGQMSIRWAAASGAETIVVVDPMEKRLAMAKRGGATAVIGQSIGESEAEIRKANHGELPRVVLDTTGNPKVLAAALPLVVKHGRMVLMGDTGTPAGQHLTSDVIMKGVTIVGAHDSHETPEWQASRIYRLFFELAATGRFDLDGLNTHVFRPDQCSEAYEVANTQRDQTMGMLFDWRSPSA